MALTLDVFGGNMRVRIKALLVAQYFFIAQLGWAAPDEAFSKYNSCLMPTRLVETDRQKSVEAALNGASGGNEMSGRKADVVRRIVEKETPKHFEISKNNIIKVADSTEGRQTVVVLGAGECNDIPLIELAERFDNVILVDINRPYMEEALGNLGPCLTPSLKKKIMLVEADISAGIGIATASADLVISSMTFSQMKPQLVQRINELKDERRARAEFLNRLVLHIEEIRRILKDKANVYFADQMEITTFSFSDQTKERFFVYNPQAIMAILGLFRRIDISGFENKWVWVAAKKMPEVKTAMGQEKWLKIEYFINAWAGCKKRDSDMGGAAGALGARTVSLQETNWHLQQRVLDGSV